MILGLQGTTLVRQRCLGILRAGQESMEVDGSSARTLALATSSADTTIKFWGAEGGEAISTLRGHVDRVNHVSFHPMGQYLGSSSHDMTWKLWDVQTEREIQSQEGHSRACYGLDFQCDGSLAVSSGLEGGLPGMGSPDRAMCAHTTRTRQTSALCSILAQWLSSSQWKRRPYCKDLGSASDEMSIHNPSSLSVDFYGSLAANPWTLLDHRIL